jgi:hypothetical protein
VIDIEPVTNGNKGICLLSEINQDEEHLLLEQKNGLPPRITAL